MVNSQWTMEAAFNGHLRLEFSPDARSRTFISNQDFQAPMHLGKGYWTGEVLLVQGVNATAGIFRGDTITTELQVHPGARVLFTSPSASRSHSMADGRASVHQKFTIRKNAWLEVWPELFIPQQETDYSQKTEIYAAAGSSFFVVEILAPGRVARNERFCFRRIDFELRLSRGEGLAALERFSLTPEHPAVRFLARTFSTPYTASGYFSFADSAIPDVSLQTIHELHCADCWIGCSEIEKRIFNLRMVAKSSALIRQKILHIRTILAPHHPGLLASPRKL